MGVKRLIAVTYVAIKIRRHVDLDKVARFYDAATRDAVHRLVVDADAVDAGEVVDELRSGAGSVTLEDLRADGVQLGGGHAWLEVRLHRLEGEPHHAPGIA